MRIPYTQQFSPASTPMKRLLAVLRQHQGKRRALVTAIASAFFRQTGDPAKIAGNTMASLKVHGVIDDTASLTDLGKAMIETEEPDDATSLLAKHILLDLDGIQLIETLREMKLANIKPTIKSLTAELRTRGVEASDNSSDLSGVLGWLRESGVLSKYDVDEQRYADLVGVSASAIDAMKDLSEGQVAFLRALLALNATDWTPHNAVVQHAESLYAGQVTFNWKDLDRSVLKPLEKAGFIEVRKAPKRTSTSRGGKAADVKPTDKFDQKVASPVLERMYKAAKLRDLRKIRSKSLSELVANVKQKKDENLRGEALEMLAIRICQLLDLEFMGWRETDEAVAAGGEVDGIMHTARLVYSRWQIQCKASDRISYETIAKEVGVAEVTLANVILVVGTGRMTPSAKSYRQRIVSTSHLNIVIIEGSHLSKIVANPASIGAIMREQAQDAMRQKPTPESLIQPTDDNGGGGGGGRKRLKLADSAGPDDPEPPSLFKPAYSTPHGSMYLGDAYDVLRFLIHKGIRVKLLVTSPPFALIKKKAYGNEDQEKYVAWFMRFAPLFYQILEPDGSFVMDIGGTWIPGIPARSVYQYKLLLQLCDSGFYLAQDFYHHNPAKLPTPAEWVTVRRLRVKDSVNNVWWFVKDPFVDVDNSRVLREYSDSMKALLKNGYKAKARPSGHVISTKFKVDRGGSIPPNLFEFANTESNSHYLTQCKQAKIKPHPARFPVQLPEFFVRFLTNPGDLVLDPFAGSNVTGEAAESLGRRWIGCELVEEYVEGSQFRFNNPNGLFSSTG